MQVTFDVFQPSLEPDEFGFKCRVAGLADDEPYCVDVWVEHDGRDVEIEPVWGAAEKVQADVDFFDGLCNQQVFIDALNADYARYDAK